MTESIRTEIAIGDPGGCPVARASDETDTRIDRVARSTGTTESGTLTEEFAIPARAEPTDPALESVFEIDGRSVYRFERDPASDCVCALVERHGCPVSDIQARDGRLLVSFYAPDVETVRGVVTDLDEHCDGIHVHQLTRGGTESENDFVFVDRSRLTERQREVLETSFEMGYFDHPKRANAGEVADALDIASSTFVEHLAAAQRKLLEVILGH